MNRIKHVNNNMVVAAEETIKRSKEYNTFSSGKSKLEFLMMQISTFFCSYKNMLSKSLIKVESCFIIL
jgi:hypothetical protein